MTHSPLHFPGQRLRKAAHCLPSSNATPGSAVQPGRPSPLSLALHGALIAMAMGAGLSAPSSAMAQATAAAALPAGTEVRNFSVPAGPLAAALDRFARTAGVNLAYDAATIQGLSTQGLTGDHPIATGLARLLAGTGLEALSQPGGGYSLRKAANAPLAQASAAPPAATPSADRALPTVVVTATSDRGPVPFVSRNTRSLGVALPEQKTPAVINTVTEEFWEATGSKTLDEVLSYVPGVSLTDNGGWTGDTISIRGFTSTAPYRDGIRQVDSGYGQSLRAMPDNIERIEVVKGPAGAEFGVAEPGGAVNFVSKQPQRETLRTFTLGIGQDGYRKLGADLTGALNEQGTVQGRLVMAYVEPEEWRAGRPDNTHRYLIAPTLNWDYSVQGQVTVGYERSHQKSPQDRGIIYLEGAWPGGFAPRDWSYHQSTSSQINETDRLRLHHEHRFSDVLKWSTAVEHGKYRYRLAEFRNADSEPGWGTLYNDDGRSWSGSRLMNLYWDNWSGDTTANAIRSSLEYRFNAAGAEHVLTGGVDRFSSTNLADSLYSTVSNTFDILAPVNNQSPAFIDKDNAIWTSTIKVKEEGVSARWLANWSQRCRTIVGLRHFDYSYDYDAAYVDYRDSSNNYPYADAYGSKKVSLRVAGSYDLSAEHTAFAGLSDGHVPQTGIQRDGSPLDPIHDQAVELGVKSRLMGGKLAWSNSLFTIRRANTSLQDPSNAPNDSFVVNGGKAKISGIESELTAQVGAHLRLRAGLALQKSRIEANDNPAFIGNRFANTPEHQVSLLASYHWGGFGLSNLTTDAGLTRIGQRWGNSGNTISLPAYTLLSLGAAYHVGPNTSVRLSIANATDRTYYTGMQDSGSRADQVMIGARRNAFVTLTHSY